MELLPEDRERLIRYTDFMKSELSDFPKFSKVDWKTYMSDRDIRRNLERWIETLLIVLLILPRLLLPLKTEESSVV
ncbi:MAG: hypothetical protein CV087_00995 [Candidatus Brocadia sp. WS118]|nr:MAG: hypothetical protein CV087_00995 [Candidatus Brocadia sp. WS118]